MKQKRTVVCDIETDGLFDYKNIWTIVCKDVNTNEQRIFKNVNKSSSDFLAYASTIDWWVGHNFISYDSKVLRELVGLRLDHTNVIDTLVLSRLLNFKSPGGHSLDSWSESFGYKKSSYDDFSCWSQELEDRCVIDVEINLELYRYFLPFLEDTAWQSAIDTEHRITWILTEVQKNGFSFNIPEATKLYQSISSRVEILLDELQKAFPPKTKLIKEVTPKGTKHGTISAVDFRWLDSNNRDLSPYSIGAPFSRYGIEIFNPGSTKQVVERFNELGWKPIEKTKGHITAERDRDTQRLPYFRQYGWKVSEDNLATLPKNAPEAAQKLTEYLLLTSRVSTLKEWLNVVDHKDSAIHGNILHIGAWTHRMSHNSPNQANIPRTGSAYGEEFRSLWRASNDRLLIGTDADGIQLRIFAHLIEDPTFRAAVESGTQSEGTDAHTVNMKALLLPHLTRVHAKTFIYAFLLGVGVVKASAILECSVEEARIAMDSFVSRYPGLEHVKKELVPRDARRGYFIGLDGRKVLCDSEHLMLAGYLQNAEAVIMKRSNILWYDQLKKEQIPFWQVNFVHDEWQTETVNDMSTANHIGDVQASSIKQTGLDLKMKVDLAGSFNIGKNWKETH